MRNTFKNRGWLVIPIAIGAAWMWFDRAPTTRPSARTEAPSRGADSTESPAKVVRLTGRVIDSETRESIGEVTLRIGDRRAVTDQTGAFSLELAARPTELTLVSDVYVLPVSPRPIGPREDITRLRVVVTRKAMIRGRVVHGDSPVADASIGLMRLSDRRRANEAMESSDVRTDDAGRFEIECMPGRVRVLAEAPGLASGESRELNIRGGEVVDDVQIDLLARGSLSILVVDPEGHGLQAKLEPLGHPSWRVDAARTDADGKAQIEALPIGEIQFRVSAEGHAPIDTPRVRIVRDRTEDLRIVLQPLGGLDGTVLAHDGQPVKDAGVVALSLADGSTLQTHSGEDGAFRFEALAGGRYELSARHPNHGPSAPVVVFSEETTSVELNLGQPSSISGVVLTPEGQPAFPFTVVVDRFAPSVTTSGKDEAVLGSRYFSPQAFERADGSFELENLAPGTYDLHAESEGVGPGVARAIHVPQNGSANDVVIRLDPGASVQGRVIDAASKEPVVAASVAVWDELRRKRKLGAVETHTDRDGRFTLHGLESGRRTVMASKRGYTRRLIAGLEIAPRTDTEIEIEIVPLTEGSPGATEFFGIGAVLEQTDDGSLLIQKTLDGAPSARFGLLPNDRILRVDGQDVTTLGIGGAVDLIRGEDGTPLTLDVVRPSDPYPFRVTLERGHVVYEEHPRAR